MELNYLFKYSDNVNSIVIYNLIRKSIVAYIQVQRDYINAIIFDPHSEKEEDLDFFLNYYHTKLSYIIDEDYPYETIIDMNIDVLIHRVKVIACSMGWDKNLFSLEIDSKKYSNWLCGYSN